MEDRAIVELFRKRDEDAIIEARKRYKDYCIYIANNVLHDDQDAEECLNDTLLAAWNSIPPQNPENLRTYLGKLIHQISIDRWKSSHRQKRINRENVQPFDEIAEIVSGGELDSRLEEAELSREISRYLYSIDQTKRNVFIRRYWYYDSISSICQRYGFGKSKVQMMLKRTRDGLAEHLRKEGFII